MGNHCIEVVCLGCASGWCDRGCGWEAEPDPETAKLIQEEHKKNSYFVHQESGCCSGFPIVSASILYGLPSKKKPVKEASPEESYWERIIES